MRILSASVSRARTQAEVADALKFKKCTLGAVIGVGAALILTRFMASLLFGVRPIDPLTFIGAPLLLFIIALAASLIPAHRATKVDPMVALRNE